jgi:hypothetical protein
MLCLIRLHVAHWIDENVFNVRGKRVVVLCNIMILKHKFSATACNSMYGHGFCMYAMECMDIVYVWTMIYLFYLKGL